MGKFRYIAVDRQGTYTKGTLDAPTIDSAVGLLREQGLWPIQCVDPNQSIWRREIVTSGPRVKMIHFTVFCRQLVTLYRSGIHMVEAVKVLAEQTESKAFRKVLLDVADELKRGSQLSAAVSKYPTVFNEVFVNMVRAGEVSGNLDDMLIRVAVFYEKEHSTREKVKSALIYPIIMSIIMAGVVLALMLFIIPQYVQSFGSMGLELPLATRMVIAASEFTQQFWYLLPMFMFVPWIFLRIFVKLPQGPYVLDHIRLKVPIFGVLWQKQALARFSRVFSSLYGAAIPLMQTLPIVANVVGNQVVQKVIMESREHIRGGQSIAEPYRKSWVFPPMIVQMMAIGEKSGSIDTMMEKVADFYEEDIEHITERLKAALEPLMIAVLGIVVGGIVLSVMLPMFQLFENL